MVQCAGLFLAGEFKMTPEVKGWVKKCDLRVAADAGAWYLKRSNLHPHVIIGDFDSLPKKHHRHFPKSEFYAYSPIKDQSDAELALRFILTKKPREIVVFGALGKKIDYMFSNFSLLAFISKNVQARILDHRCEIFFVTQKLHIQGKKEDRVSIFPLSLQGAVVTTRNLSYPLIHERLHFGSNGMNNQMVQNTCSIQIHRGSVWAFHFFGS